MRSWGSGSQARLGGVECLQSGLCQQCLQKQSLREDGLASVCVEKFQTSRRGLKQEPKSAAFLRLGVLSCYHQDRKDQILDSPCP